MNNNIGIIRRCEMNFIRSEMEQYGLLPLEGKLLAILSSESQMQEDLGNKLHLDKGRIAKAIASLEKKGLVLRRTNADNRRQKFVSLTENGQAMMLKIEAIFNSWDAVCYSGFTEADILVHKDRIKRIAENVMNYQNHKGGPIHG